MIIDSHAHLHFDRFDEDRTEVIQRAHDAGVSHMVTIGTHRESSLAALELAEAESCIFATAGIHPLAVDRFEESDWQVLESLWVNERIVGIGETGLDYYYTPETQALQRQLFQRHLIAGATFDLPVVVHIRDAFDDAFDLLGTHLSDAGGIVHCFTGGPEECEKALDLGMYVSISGIATFKNAKKLQQAIPLIPKERLLVETDSPYLAPVPHRGGRCEPAFTADTARFIAELRGEPFEELASFTRQNTLRIFARMGAQLEE